MKKRQTVEAARNRTVVVNISRARTYGFLSLGIISTLIFAGLLLSDWQTQAIRSAYFSGLIGLGFLPLAVGLSNLPYVGQSVVVMTKSHLQLLERSIEWDDIQSVELERAFGGSQRIILSLADASRIEIEDGNYTLSLDLGVYEEIRKRVR